MVDRYSIEVTVNVVTVSKIQGIEGSLVDVLIVFSSILRSLNEDG
jgi:hypothetical protein